MPRSRQPPLFPRSPRQRWDTAAQVGVVRCTMSVLTSCKQQMTLATLGGSVGVDSPRGLLQRSRGVGGMLG